MCGIFGYVARPGRTPNMERLRTIAKVTERRGRHAFGFAWIDSRGRLRCYKSRGRISDALGLLRMAEDAQMLIGHTRFATQGDPDYNSNNHPHPCDGGWLVHNGMIPHYQRINDAFGLRPVSACDSETLALLIEQLDGTLMERVIETVELIEGRPATVAALWSRPRRLVVARSGNPLHIGSAGAGIYFASLRGGLPANARAFPDDTVRIYSHTKGGDINVEEETIPPRAETGDLFAGLSDGADGDVPARTVEHSPTRPRFDIAADYPESTRRVARVHAR